MERRDDILASLDDIPTLPAAATNVLALVQSPDTSIGEIMDAVALDPQLTADVLRLSNSSFFAGPREIASLQEAGVLFGTQRLLQLVLASAVFPLVRKPVQGYDLPPGRLLEHLSAVALASEHLAKLVALDAPNYIFTAGLLHDIGKIALGTFLEVDAQPILDFAEREAIPFVDAERAVLGIDHAELGAELLARWDIPEKVVRVVRFHHAPEQVEEDTIAVDLVHMADMLAVQCGLGLGIDGMHYVPSPVTQQRLPIPEHVLEKAASRVFADLLDMRTRVTPGPGDEA